MITWGRGRHGYPTSDVNSCVCSRKPLPTGSRRLRTGEATIRPVAPLPGKITWECWKSGPVGNCTLCRNLRRH